MMITVCGSGRTSAVTSGGKAYTTDGVPTVSPGTERHLISLQYRCRLFARIW